MQRGEAPALRAEEIAALLPDAASALLEYVVTDDDDLPLCHHQSGRQAGS